MISLFTATNTVSLAVKVPVTGIDIIGDNVVYLDFDAEETYKIDYAVYPTNAQNKNVTFSTEAVDGFDLAELEYVDGYVVPKSIGTAKVYLTTVDGGYKDSFIVQVDSNMLQEINSTLERDAIIVGEKVSILTDFKPATASDLMLTYSSSNESVAKVNAKGQVTGMGRGTATITVRSVANPSVVDTVTIDVYQNDPIVIAQPQLSTWNHSGTVNLSMKDNLDYEYSYKAYGADGEELDTAVFAASFDKTNKENGHILFNYYFTNKNYLGSVKVVICASYDGTTVESECQINRVNEIQLSFDKATYGFSAGQNVMATFSLTPEDADVTYTYSVSNGNVQVVTVGDGYVALYAKSAGVTTLTLRATDEVTGDYKEATTDIVIKPKSLIINELASTFGDENVLAIGKTEADGSDSRVSISLTYKAAESGVGFVDNLLWETDSEFVSVDKNGVIRILDEAFTGNVKITGVFRYGDVEYATAPMTVYCVGDGVNVRSFAELYGVVEAGRPVVLQTDVVEDFGYINGAMYYNESTVKKMHTTYDDTYYKNIGKESDAFVRCLLDFTNNLYGNGHTINAGNVTMQLDSTGALKSDALFRGPLNFVSMTESEVSAVSVKAQDNICFAVRGGVTLRNVKLYGCTLEADEDNNFDLTDLNYVGTTVEVLGDDVDILYSRIHNGRTVLRAFGDAADPTKVIHLNISNSVLGGAREFIIRMGSNCFVETPDVDSIDSYSPSKLPGDTANKFPSQKNYSKMTEAEKQAYDESFIKTFVNVKNSVFTDAGIFAIGVDSHFSGVYLDQGNSIFQGGTYGALVKDWYNLARTSYGAKLTFEGEVRMYNWKDLAEIDSSTLIEIVGESSFAGQLEFNLSEMVAGIANNSAYKNVVYNKDGKQYVHAGIAFFGGGYNYGVFEYKNSNESQFSQLIGYEIGLGDVGKGFLASAAGNEDFYFLLHDSTTQFLPEAQDRLLESEDAYECIYRKD